MKTLILLATAAACITCPSHAWDINRPLKGAEPIVVIVAPQAVPAVVAAQAAPNLPPDVKDAGKVVLAPGAKPAELGRKVIEGKSVTPEDFIAASHPAAAQITAAGEVIKARTGDIRGKAEDAIKSAQAAADSAKAAADEAKSSIQKLTDALLNLFSSFLATLSSLSLPAQVILWSMATGFCLWAGVQLRRLVGGSVTSSAALLWQRYWANPSSR